MYAQVQQRSPQVSHNAKKTPLPSKLKQRGSRGRVLAEGDLDPAAGSRDEPFKAVGRNPSTKLISQSVCIKLI